MKLLFTLVPALILNACNGNFTDKADETDNNDTIVEKNHEIIVGAARTQEYLPLLKGKKIAVVANHTSLIGNTHLVDTLKNSGIDIVRIFSPEHGFRGAADAGEKVNDTLDEKTNIPLVSLYGSSKKPDAKHLSGVDMVVFDIQDVGVRFYTYTSTMHYVMEACAENNIPFLVLDRPNPNGFYVDGNILDTAYRSFVGMHPVPVVHGMTIAEYARMINEEGWLKDGVKCDLKYISCANYTHDSLYTLPVKPSPNLPNMTAIYLYPSLCWFEGTPISVGRGTDKPFQQVGHPAYADRYEYYFTPESAPGAKNPKLKDQKCYGIDLSGIPADSLTQKKRIDLTYLLTFYSQYPEKEEFFNRFFTTLAGGKTLQQQIKTGMSGKEIRQSWQKDLEKFKEKRKKYLIYPDFK